GHEAGWGEVKLDEKRVVVQFCCSWCLRPRPASQRPASVLTNCTTTIDPPVSKTECKESLRTNCVDCAESSAGFSLHSRIGPAIFGQSLTQQAADCHR